MGLGALTDYFSPLPVEEEISTKKISTKKISTNDNTTSPNVGKIKKPNTSDIKKLLVKTPLKYPTFFESDLRN